MSRTFDLRMQAEFEERYEPDEYVFLARGAAVEAALKAMPAHLAAHAVAEMSPEVARAFVMYQLYEKTYWGETPTPSSTKWADELAETYDARLLEEAASVTDGLMIAQTAVFSAVATRGRAPSPRSPTRSVRRP